MAASAFRQHGHHRDPAYDNLVLHVVFFGDDGRETCLACGRAVPTLALGPWVARRAEELHRWLARPARWQEPCRTALARLGPAAVATLLEDAGDARFRREGGRLRLGHRRGGGEEEVLYRGLLEGLGYSRNRDPFRRLAEALPWQALRRLLASWRPEEQLLTAEAALLGTGSFLPVERSADPYVAALQERWRAGVAGVGPFLPWELIGRPANHPARRLAGAARLLVRHVDSGLLPGLADGGERGSGRPGRRPSGPRPSASGATTTT